MADTAVAGEATSMVVGDVVAVVAVESLLEFCQLDDELSSDVLCLRRASSRILKATKTPS